MISVEHARTMARYNQWQNQSLYGAADTLSDEARRLDPDNRSLQRARHVTSWFDRDRPLRDNLREISEVKKRFPDHAVIADPDTLERREFVAQRGVALIAARVGTTRLIDNRMLERG